MQTIARKGICFSAITIYSLAALLIVMFIFTLCTMNKIRSTHSDSMREMIEIDNSIRESIDKGLLIHKNDIQGEYNVDSLSILALDSRITHCRKEIDSHKINMEAELDNELNKITIWMTIIILVFGLINIGLTIGNHVSGALEASRVKDDIDGFSAQVDLLRNELKEVQTELSMVWDINDFDIKTAIKEYLCSKEYTSFIRILEVIKERCCQVNQVQDYGRIRLILRHTENALFKNFEHLVLMNNGKDFDMLNDLHKLIYETAIATDADIEYKIKKLTSNLVKMIRSLNEDYCTEIKA